jgi:thiol-disulfide isomerase/thioredoxin
MKIRHKIVGLVLGLFAITTLNAQAELLAVANSPLAPDFTLKTHGGGNYRLTEQRGSVILVNFWATWCGPCRQEMPILDALAKKYADLGVQVVGVNVETETDGVQSYLSEVPVSFPILLDLENIASKAYDVKAMPTTVIIDKDGRVRALHRSYQPGYEKKYEDDINGLLAE